MLLIQEDYNKLEEREKLRFVITSFKVCKKYYSCDVKCSLELIEEDERFKKVENFVKKYNLSADDFAILLNIFITQKVRKYLRMHTGQLFLDLKEIIHLYELK